MMLRHPAGIRDVKEIFDTKIVIGAFDCFIMKPGFFYTLISNPYAFLP